MLRFATVLQSRDGNVLPVGLWLLRPRLHTARFSLLLQRRHLPATPGLLRAGLRRRWWRWWRWWEDMFLSGGHRLSQPRRLLRPSHLQSCQWVDIRLSVARNGSPPRPAGRSSWREDAYLTPNPADMRTARAHLI
jgi:hypothetical protein